MHSNDTIRLRHMLDAAREAVSFAAGKNRGDLDTDRMRVLALVKEIEIIGEAAFKVSQECRQKCPSIPWPDIIGMRHRLIHAYFDVDLDIVWDTVTNELPALITVLQQLLSRADL